MPRVRHRTASDERARIDRVYIVFAAQRVAFALMVLGMLIFVYLWYVHHA